MKPFSKVLWHVGRRIVHQFQSEHCQSWVRGRRDHGRYEWRQHAELHLLRIEDRVLLDAAGLLTPTLAAGGAMAALGAPGGSALEAVDTPTATPVAEDAAGAVMAGMGDDTQLSVQGGALVLHDQQGPRDNQFQILGDEHHLIVHDTANFGITTDVSGAMGNGSSLVRIPWSSLIGVGQLHVQLAGGTNTIVFDASHADDTLLAHFSSIDIAELPTASRNDVAIIGNTQLDATLARAANAQREIQLVGPTATNRITIGARIHAELGQFDEVLVAMSPAAGVPSHNAESLSLTGTTTIATGGRDALDVQWEELQPTSVAGAGVKLFDNQVVQITGTAQAAVDSHIIVDDAGSVHRNRSLVLDTGNVTDGSRDQITLQGDLLLWGDLEISTGTLSVAGDVSAFGSVHAVANAGIAFTETGVFSAALVELQTPDGAISGANGGAAHLRTPFALLSAAKGIGSSAAPLLTDVEQLAPTVTQQGSVYIQEQNSLRLRNTVLPNGTLSVTVGGSLQVGAIQVIESGDDNQILLVAEGGDILLQGLIRKTIPQSTAPPDARLPDVRIVATHGAIVDHPTYVGSAIWAYQVELQAANGIGAADNILRTSIEQLRADVTAAGGIYLSETSRITIDLTTTDGPVLIESGQTIELQQVTTAGDHQQHDVHIRTLDGDIVVAGPVRAGSVVGAARATLTLEASGAILTSDTRGELDTLLVGHRAVFHAGDGVGGADTPLRTQVRQLTVESGGAVWLNNLGDVQLGDLTTSAAIASRDSVSLGATGSVVLSGSILPQAALAGIHLNAGGQLTIHGRLETTLGTILLEANDDLRAPADAELVTQQGTIQLVTNKDSDDNGRLIFAGAINHGVGETLIVTNGSRNHTSVYVGTLVGDGGFKKYGGGTLRFDAAASLAYQGDTNVHGGSLIVDGRLDATRAVRVFGAGTLGGSGDIDAPISSGSTQARIVPTGNLRLGDGTSGAFHWEGNLTVGPQQRVTIRAADLAKLGVSTSLAHGSALVAPGGVEIGEGDAMTGDGQVVGRVVVRSGGTLDPSTRIDVTALSDNELTLQPGAILSLQFGAAPDTNDVLVVDGPLSVDRAVLDLRGTPAQTRANQEVVLIENRGELPFVGRFVDAQGRTLEHGATVQLGGLEFVISYQGGPDGNDLVLIGPDRQIYFVVPHNADSQSLDGFFFYLTTPISFEHAHDEDSVLLLPTREADGARSASVVSAVQQVVDDQVDIGFRLFFRVVDELTGEDGEQEFELQPEQITALPRVFEQHPFVDGHYRVYLQEAGSQEERLILDIHLFEGRIVPENFRGEPADVERWRQRDVEQQDGADHSASPANTDTRLPSQDVSTESPSRKAASDTVSAARTPGEAVQVVSAESYSLSRVSRYLRQLREGNHS